MEGYLSCPDPGPFQAPIEHSANAFSGSTGNRAHAKGKYRFKWVFPKKHRFTRCPILQNGGPVLEGQVPDMR